MAPDKVAVKVNEDPEFSAIELAELVKVKVGAVSFSVIVIVTDWEAFYVASLPKTVSILIIAVSSPS